MNRACGVGSRIASTGRLFHSQETIDACLRVDQVSVQSVSSFFKGMAIARGKAPDVQSALQVERNLQDQVSELMQTASTRPSLLQPVVQACFGVAGVVVGATARSTERHSVVAGIYDALIDVYTDQLREMANDDDSAQVRRLVKNLRDAHESSFPDGVLPIPDVMSLTSSTNMHPSQYVSLIAKDITQRILNVSKTI